MGTELIVLYIALGSLGLFGVNKGVEVYRHNVTIEADVETQCFKYAKEIRECHYLNK